MAAGPEKLGRRQRGSFGRQLVLVSMLLTTPVPVLVPVEFGSDQDVVGPGVDSCKARGSNSFATVLDSADNWAVVRTPSAEPVVGRAAGR